MSLTDLLNHNFQTCAKAEIKDSTVCIAVNGEKFQSHDVTLTLIGQCPILNHYFLSYLVHRQTHTQTL